MFDIGSIYYESVTDCQIWKAMGGSPVGWDEITTKVTCRPVCLPCLLLHDNYSGLHCLIFNR